MIFNLYKKRGETPLECVQRFVTANSDLKGKKMSYLGRLDPMAEGVLLVASEEDIKRKEEFLNLDKEYDFVALFGFATDTYDVLGRIVRTEKLQNLDEINLVKIAKIYEGEREQKYPRFSSPNIKKVRKGTFSEEDSPKKKVTIHKIDFLGLDSLSNKEMLGRLLMDISKVKGDFRQHEILVLWSKILEGYKDQKLFLGKFKARVSSGTYVRSIVNDMGNTLGVGATALSITRNKVGDKKIEDSIKF